MRTRTTLLAGLLAGATVLATSASAAPTVVISDAKGDAKGAQTAYDILSVTMETTKASKAKNAPLKDFRIVMQLGAAPDIKPGTSYQIFGEHSACGAFFAFVYWSAQANGPTDSVQFGECGEPDATGQVTNFLIDPAVKIEGTKIVFTVSARAMPREAKAGSMFSDLIAYTSVTEPVIGYTPLDFAPDEADDAAAIDYARASKPYKYGS